MSNNGDNHLPLTLERNVNTLLSRFPDRLVLRSAGNKSQLFILGLFLFGLGLFGVIQRKFIYGGISLLILSGIFFALIIYQIIKGPPVLTLDKDYISEDTFIKRLYKWENISNIRPIYNERGDSIISRVPKEFCIAFSLNSNPKSDVMIANTYGFSLEEFARLIIGWQERALQKSAPPNPPLQT